MSSYQTFLEAKGIVNHPTGIPSPPPVSPMLYPFQRDIVRWALRRGRAAIFADCGLGKTPMQLEWARAVCDHAGGRVLIMAPLAVAQQTIGEGAKFGVSVKYARYQRDAAPVGITICNYEMAEHFEPSEFAGIVLDESSILKSYSGKFRTYLMERWAGLSYRLCCTATPAPNDYMELGNHAEFLGVMRGSEMLSAFFINDPGNVGRYRLKGHAQDEFWRWMASWSVMIRRPSNLGYEDGAFVLPRLNIRELVVAAPQPLDGALFALEAHTMEERRHARRDSIEARVDAVASLANGDNQQWLVWCDLNAESERLARLISGAVEVKGSDDLTDKEERLSGFATGRVRVLVTKPSIAGFGMNFQRCARMAFTGLSDSYEQFYQAVRRCWRFGQTREVVAYVVTAETEGAVVANIKRKERQAESLFDGMAQHMAYVSRGEIRQELAFAKAYNRDSKVEVPSWLMN